MHPIEFAGSNLNLVKPEDMTDEQCFGMPAYHGIDEETGYPYFVTHWMPNKEDLDALNAGRPLILGQMGRRFQPVFMHTLNEHGEQNI